MSGASASTDNPRKRKWDIPPDGLAPPGDGDGEDEDPVSPGENMMMELVELYCQGALSATKLCIIAHWADLAGVKEAKQYALHPGASSGHYQRKLDTALGFNAHDKRLYSIEVPIMVDGSREKEQVLVQLPHEALAEQLEAEPEVLEDWQANIEREHWVDVYEQHPTVRAAAAAERSRILPLAVYMDSSEYQRNDSLIAFTVHFLPSQRRHLVFAVRKLDLCACGCGGWCTLHPLFRLVAWSLSMLISGLYPRARHDGSEWGPKEDRRRDLAGQDLGFKAVVVDVCGDWSEFALRWGFPAWNAANPCFLCDISLEQLRRGDDQFTLRDTESYCQACQEAENWTMIPDADLHAKVRYALVSTTAGRGRHLSEDVPELLLQAGDRLDPQPMLQDVMDFDTLEPPFVVCFWRTRDAPIVHRRHPLLTEELGIGLHSFSIDILHTLHLGVFQFWLAEALWHILLSDMFYSNDIQRLEDKVRLGLLRLSALLKEWYPKYARTLSEQGAKNLTRVNKLKPGMVGTKKRKQCKLKAAETRHFLPFVLELLQEHADVLRDRCNVDSLILSGQALVSYMDVLAREPRRVSERGCQQLRQYCHDHTFCY